MKALVLTEDKQLIMDDVVKPVAGPGEVVVKIHAAALNHREIWISKGLYPGLTLPCILGADGTGVVESVGENVQHDWVGKDIIVYPAYGWGESEQAPTKKFRVLGMPDPGTITEYIKVPVENLFLKPEYLSWQQAAAIPVAALTAWRALMQLGQMNKDSKVLITGIGGGVAQAGLGFVNAIGAEAFVTSSSNEKIAYAVDLGAKGGVDYKKEDWHSELKELSGGIDIVLDSSPSPNLDDYLKFMNLGGKIVAYGSTGARKTTLNISKFFLRQIQFIGTAMGSPKEFGEMLKFMATHRIQPVVHQTFDFENAKDAFSALQTGNQIGKIVITMNP